MRFTSAAGVAIEPIFRYGSGLLRDRNRLQTCVQDGQALKCGGIATFGARTRAIRVDSHNHVYWTLCDRDMLTQLEIA
jgi:hypothetical protein